MSNQMSSRVMTKLLSKIRARTTVSKYLFSIILKLKMEFRGFNHRDKTRVQMPAKMFPHLKVLCMLFMGPTLGFDTKERNSFLIKSGVFFMIKARF